MRSIPSLASRILGRLAPAAAPETDGDLPPSRAGEARLGLAGKVSLVILAAFAIYATVRTFNEALQFNDFEDNYHVAAKCAAERCAELYKWRGPVNHQYFVYPPSASVYFYPFYFFTYEKAAALFTLIKVVALFVLMWASISWQRGPPLALDTKLVLITVATLISAQPLNSDIFTGQINIIVAFLALVGLRLIMESRRWDWAGALLLASAATIKGAPLLLFAAVLLQRRFKALAIGLAAVVLLNFALPPLWYGEANAEKFSKQFPVIVNSRMIDNAAGRDLLTGQDLQTSLPEVVLFTMAQLKADPDDYFYDWNRKRLYTSASVKRGVKWARTALPKPCSPETARAIWFAIAVSMGILFLGVRYWLTRSREIPWTWDAAVLIIIMILLSPVTRRAQLVSLIFPVGYMLLALYHLARSRGGIRALLLQERSIMITAFASLVLFLLSDKPGILLPGFAMPFRISLPLAFFGMLALMVQLKLADPPAKCSPKGKTG